MGCCQARDKHPQEDDPQHSYKSSSPSLCPADAELDAIETYAMALLGTKEGWRIDFDQSPLLIRHLNYTRVIDPQVLIDAMEKESLRMKWDSKVKGLTVESHRDGFRTIQTRFSMLFITRDLLERRITKVYPDEIRVIYYTPSDPNPADPSKAHTYFGLHRYLASPTGTTVVLFSQTDYCLPEFIRKTMHFVKGEAGKWLQAYYNHTLELVGAS